MTNKKKMSLSRYFPLYIALHSTNTQYTQHFHTQNTTLPTRHNTHTQRDTHLPHFPHSLPSIKFIYLYKNNKKIGAKGEVLGTYEVRLPHWHKVFFHFYLFQSKKIRCHHIVLGEEREEGLRLEPRKKTSVIAPPHSVQTEVLNTWRLAYDWNCNFK
jgi:hypothetical protein